MLTCLCDALYGEVGIATVKVLEHAGCEVVFEEGQTCCGQPPFNSGDWESARKIASHFLAVFGSSDEAIVSPSGSCTAMLRDGYAMLGMPIQNPESKIQDSKSKIQNSVQSKIENRKSKIQYSVQSKIQNPKSKIQNLHAFELSEFLVKELGLDSWPAAKPYPRKVAYHRACHGRALGLSNEAETLLASIPELKLMPIENPEQCCGFGGAFCVTQGKLSSGIGIEKLLTLKQSGAEEVVSTDMGCLMHLEGLAHKADIGLKFRHLAEVLADTI